MSGGASQCGVILIRDITQRSVQQLQEEFIARVGHELRTPLTPLQAYLQMMMNQLASKPDDARARALAGRALAQVQQLRRMVDDLQDVTRSQTGKYTLNLELVRLDE